MSFFKKYDALLHPSSGALIIDSDCDIASEQSQEYFLHLTENLHLPPYSECIVTTRSNKEFKGPVFVHNSPFLSNRSGIFTAKGLIDSFSHEINIAIANLSDQPYSLPSGTIVALLEPVTSTEYVTCLDAINDESDEDLKIPKDLYLSNSDLNLSEKLKIKKLISKYSDLLSKNSKAPGRTSRIYHNIEVENERPINCPPYHAGPKERQVIETQINEMLESDVIKPSKSPWASPIVLVKKKTILLGFV